VGDISKDAEFSFGTNDLTRMTFGFSRDDAGKSCESEPFARLAAAGNSGGFYWLEKTNFTRLVVQKSFRYAQSRRSGSLPLTREVAKIFDF